MQRNTGNTESLTVEYGFLDSKADDVDQLKSNWQNYAEAVVRAIIEYLNLTYIPVGVSNNYIVRPGDTLWSIAKKNSVSVDDIKNENGLTSSLLSIGQVIKIPNKNDNINTHIVKSGDTLYKLSKMYNTTVNDLMNLNNLNSNVLSIGQKLLIPIKKEYIVKPGDTLYKISKDFNTTVENLINLNNLTNTNLSIGQKIFIN